MSILHQGFFLLRRPLLPLNVLYDFNERVNQQPELFEQEIIQFASQPAILNAIYVASPELYYSFVGYLEGKTKTGIDKLAKTLYKYLIRMTSRSTPFGLFAGCAVGRIGDETRITFDTNIPYYTHSRLDTNYVAELTDRLLAKDTIRQQLKFHVNTSLYRLGDTYRYVESSVKNKKRQYVLASVERSEYLDRVLNRARHGATTREMADAVVSDDITMSEAEQYVGIIIDSQLVVSELDVTVTGIEFFNLLINRLDRMDGTAEDVSNLKAIAALLQTLNPGVKQYQQVETLVKRHFVTTGSKDLVQTDLFYNTLSCELGEQVINTLAKEYKQIECLGNRKAQPDLDQFKKSFLERYEQREMPLMEVLDNETGIGFGVATAGRVDNLPLLDEVQLPGTVRHDTTEWAPLIKFKEKLYQQAVAEGTQVITLTDTLLHELRKEVPVLSTAPDSFYLFGNLIADSQDDVNAGNFKFALNAMGGPSGMKLIGRFCHGNPTLTKQVIEAMQAEENFEPDAIYAEVTHLPEARVGNVLMRPHFRTYEIPYLAGSSLPTEQQITPDDLLVSVSTSGELVLRSKRLNKRVYPRLTNAHKFSNGLPIYRFLCELSYQASYQCLNWNWGFLAKNSFLPRIEYKHWLLSRATWNLDKDMFIRLLGKDADCVKEWQMIRHAFGVPRFVQLQQGDSELLIDGESAMAVQILTDAVRKYSKVSLVEFVDGGGKGLLSDGATCYANEMILPLLNTKVTNVKPFLPAMESGQATATPPKRTFMVGSEWLYVKIYAGTKTADRLLASVIKPLADKLMLNGTIEKWFFIRYADPDDHIRVRFYNAVRPNFWNTVLEQLSQRLCPLIENGTVRTMQVDTYRRELERYGQHAFEQVESIFMADSQATVSLLDMLDGDAGERYRWLLGLRSVDMLLNDLSFGLPEKKKLMDKLQENFFEEFKGNTQLTVQLNNKYREHTKEITSFLQPANDVANEIEDAIELMQERSASIQIALSLIPQGTTVPKHSFAASLVHMSLNRLFVSKHRVHELIIYHYLKKFYESKLARTAKNTERDVLHK